MNWKEAKKELYGEETFEQSIAKIFKKIFIPLFVLGMLFFLTCANPYFVL